MDATQLTTALREWRAVQQARWLKKGKPMPANSQENRREVVDLTGIELVTS